MVPLVAANDGYKNQTFLLDVLKVIFLVITGEIINPWTGGKLQLSEEIDDNSAQEGEYNCLFTYFFTVNQNYRKVLIIELCHLSVYAM